MIEFRKTKFIKSCPNRTQANLEPLPEIIFIGKSNVGKSSLINALCENKSLAFTSSKPGHTRLLNYFNVNNHCYLVDAPGYGYNAAGQSHTLLFGEMMEDYFSSNKDLAVVVYLLDSRRVPNEDDIDFYNFLTDNNIPFIIVMTKCDKLNQSEKAKIQKNLINAFGIIDKSNILLTSIKNQSSLLELKKSIANFIK